MTYLNPILEAYKTNQSYAALEHAVFPSYFHGKCQVNGVDPSGCPNPDCPVVCGTPGSLVHFYSKLCSLVFDCIQDYVQSLLSPDSRTYQEVEKSILADACPMNKNEKISYTRRMQTIFKQFSSRLETACGGADKLSKCSWENEMKSFILSFP